MGVELMEFGIYMRNGVISTIRSVWRHPFLVCAMFGVIYMSRSYPYMFSLLVSASPVLVCTALLLGALLLSGQQNTPESEREKRARYEEIARKNGMLYDANLDELNDRCYVERCSKSARDEVEKVGVDSGLLVDKLDGDGDGDDNALCKDGNESKSSEIWGASRELDGTMQQLGDGAEMVDHYAIISKVIGELLESESEHEKSEEDCSDSDYDSGGENVNSSPNAQRHKDDEDEEEEDDVAASDSGSERAESSSPDASMDVMMPILDELHPLLDEDAVQPVQMSRVGSDAELNEESPRSSSSSIESGEETEAHGDDDDEVTKEDEAKSVITWTEEDQKNLMDVGSSEIERNQRLERILRRRKNMSMVPEINLMEFENSDFQLNIAPISTARRNPFDLPDDANSPPGSAPSILSQRRMNPFDLPYDSSEWDQPSQQPFLRRRDNFVARPSLFGPKGQERQPARFRPFFIQELLTFSGESSGVSCGEGVEQQVGIGCSDGVLNRDPNQHSELDQIEGVEVDYDQGQSSKIMGFKLNEEEIM